MVYSYSKVRDALGESQSVYHWKITFSGEGVEFDENLEIRVTGVSLPAPSIEHTEIQIGGYTLSQPGKVNKSGEVTATFVEGTDAAVLNKIHEWLEKYWSGGNGDTTGKQKTAKELYVDATIQQMDNADNTTQVFTLIDCLPSIDYGAELGQDAGTQAPVLTLKYNDYRWGSSTGGSW